MYSIAKKIGPRILPVDIQILEPAYCLMDRYPSIFARDAVHEAICLVPDIEEIVSFDKDIDSIGGLNRMVLS